MEIKNENEEKIIKWIPLDKNSIEPEIVTPIYHFDSPFLGNLCLPWRCNIQKSLEIKWESLLFSF